MSETYDMDSLRPAKFAAEFFHTTINVILMWRNRGWIDDDGERKYLAIAERDDNGRLSVEPGAHANGPACRVGPCSLARTSGGPHEPPPRQP